MAELCLTKGLRTIISEHRVEELSQWKWSTRIPRLGTHYAYRSIHGGRKHIHLHRQIMESILGRSLVRGETVDHKNGDTLDNRDENLRVASNAQQTMNRRPSWSKRSRFKGVFYQGPSRPGDFPRTKCWVARCGDTHIGYFASEEEAAQAYDSLARERFGEFARLNFEN